MAARIDYLIGTATFAKLLRLPLSYTDGPPIRAQIARLREFQSVRDLFAGPAAGAIVDFPFTIVALAADARQSAAGLSWCRSRPASFSPSTGLCRRALAAGVRASAECQRRRSCSIMSPTRRCITRASNAKAPRAYGSHRFRLMSADAATRAGDLQDRSAAVEALSQFLNSAAALAVLVFGTLMVLDGTITVGALIATMALTWRILSPAQQLFQTLGSIGSVARVYPIDEPDAALDRRVRRQHSQSGARAAGRADIAEPGQFALREGFRSGADEHQPQHPGGQDDRRDRTERCGQVERPAPRAGSLSAAKRCRDDRRRRHPAAVAETVAPRHRLRAAEDRPFLRHDRPKSAPGRCAWRPTTRFAPPPTKREYWTPSWRCRNNSTRASAIPQRRTCRRASCAS